MKPHTLLVAFFLLALLTAISSPAAIAAGGDLVPLGAPPGAPQGTPAPHAPGSAEPLPDIRDVHPPVAGPAPEASLAVPVAVALLLVLVGLALALGWRHRRRRRPLAAWQAALQAIERTRALARPETAYAFASTLTQVVRDWLDERYDLGVRRQTTEEFLADLTRSEDPLLQTWRPFLQDFLDDCDVAKYAGGRLETASMDAMIDSARRLVEETRPIEKAPAAQGRRPSRLRLRRLVPGSAS